MDKLEPVPALIVRSALLALVLFLSACAMQTPEPPPPVVVKIPEPVPEPEPELPHPEPAPVEPEVVYPETFSRHVAVVLSDRKPAYENVAIALSGLLEDHAVYDLTDKSHPPRAAFRAIADSDAQVVVAVGLFAAKVAKSLSQVPVVFSQVFNVHSAELIADDFKGVSVLPPLDLQFREWKVLDPDLHRVGVIIGSGHEDIVTEAQEAADAHGIQLLVQQTRSDRETLYLFNRMTPEIDGFLLFPDNRVLSAAVLKQIMVYASRHRVQVAVFNDALIAYGATLSSTALEEDIAAQIVEVLNRMAEGDTEALADVSPLTDIRIRINEELVERYELSVAELAYDDSAGAPK